MEINIKQFTEEQGKELKTVFDGLTDELKEKMAKIVEENEQLKTIPELMEKLNGIEGLQKAFNELSISVSKMKTGGAPKKVKSVADQIDELLVSKKDVFKAGGFKVKTFLESSTDNVAAGSDIPVREADPMWYKEPDAPTELLDLLPKRPTSTGVIQWTERVSKTNNTVWIQEGTAPTNQSDFKWKTVKADVVKITEFMKASKESLSDIPQLRSEINSLISTGIRQKLNRALLDETVANDSNAFNGIDYYSQAFAPGYKLEAGVTPNEFDVIMAAKNQTKQNQFNANVGLISVKKLGQMSALRDGNNNYLQVPFANVQAGDSIIVNGVRLIAATWVDDDNFYVFDASYAPLFVKNNIELEMYDQNEDDALADLVTIKATGRFYLRIVANYQKAFVKGVFTDAKATLTAGS